MSTSPDTAVNILEELLHQAFMQGASDVHFESGEKFFRVRFRIDGLLRIAATPSPHLRDAIVSRLKVLARMDIAEKRVPQDGRIQHPHLDQTVDLRVSSLPTLHGEKIVVRILNFSRERPSLDVLGYEPDDHAKLRHAIGRPHGLILMTGPTGSGKRPRFTAASHYSIAQRSIFPRLKTPLKFTYPGSIKSTSTSAQASRLPPHSEHCCAKIQT
jgi:type IV pilus assembly protein PilB